MYSFLWFWMNFTFVFPFFFGAILVLKNVEKESHWYLKTAVSFLGFIGWMFLWQFVICSVDSSLSKSIPFSHLTFFVQIVMMILYIRFSYKVNIWTTIFATTITYSLQHFSNRLYLVICSVLSLVIHNDYFNNDLWYSWIGILLCCLIMGVSYFLWWLLLLRKFNQESFDELVDKKVQVITSGITIFASIFINSYIANYPNVTSFILIMDFLMSLTISFLVILLDYSSVHENKTKKENEKLLELLENEKKDYEHSKESYDLINIKLHDIKHLLNTLNSSTSPSTIDNIKDCLTSFEHSIKTGNEAIDVIVNKKEKECLQKGIKFTCFLDARGLDYISPYEIYTLFDNALNNAIEASMKCDKDRRIISVHGKRKNEFIQIIITNYFKEDIAVNSSGLPITKKDRNFHGFGIRSMKMLSEKYDGLIHCEIKEELFNLYISLPLNRNCDTAKVHRSQL